MGFSREQSINALRHTSNLDQAADFALLHPHPQPQPPNISSVSQPRSRIVVSIMACVCKSCCCASLSTVEHACRAATPPPSGTKRDSWSAWWLAVGDALGPLGLFCHCAFFLWTRTTDSLTVQCDKEHSEASAFTGRPLYGYTLVPILTEHLVPDCAKSL